MDVAMMQGMAQEDVVAKTSIGVSRVATAMIVPVGFRVTGQCSVPSTRASRRNLQAVITVLLGCVCLCSFSANVLALPYVLEEGAGVEVCEALLAANNRASPAAANDNFGLTSPYWGFPNDDEPIGRRLWDYVDYLWQNEVNPAASFPGGKTEWRATPEQMQQMKDRFYALQSDGRMHGQTKVAWFDIDNDGVLDLMWTDPGESGLVIVVNRTYPCPTCNPSFTWDRERTLRMFQHRSWKARGGKYYLDARDALQDNPVVAKLLGPMGSPVPTVFNNLVRYELMQYKNVNYFVVMWESFRPSEREMAGDDDHHKKVYHMQGDKVTHICSLRF